MQTQRVIGVVLFVVGIVLLVMGIGATDSFASQVSKLFTGMPTDRAAFLLLGGIAAIIAGASIAMLSFRSPVR